MQRRIMAWFLGTLGAAAAWAESSVWRAELDGAVVYLGGTCHLLRAGDFPLPAEFDQAYAHAATVWFETDLERMQSADVQLELLSRGMLGDGVTLRDQLNDAAWTALTEYCAAQQLPLAAFVRMKPWMLAVTLAVWEWQKQGAVAEGVDLHYHRRAAADGKPRLGLESIEQHLDYLAGLGAGQESELVLSTLEDLRHTGNQIDALIQAWREGDLAYFDREMIGAMREEFPAVYESLVAGRNRAWLPQIQALLATPETELVLVGAGHFGGEDGLLALLRRAGVRVAPLAGAPPP